MSKQMRQPFTPGGKFIASRAFPFNGRRYGIGDEFPWRTIGCSVRKLRQLYEGRFLNNTYGDESELEVVDPPVEEETTNTEDTVEELTAYDPEIHEIINPERGEWYMADADGNRLLKLEAKEAKRLRKKHETEDINMDEVI